MSTTRRKRHLRPSWPLQLSHLVCSTCYSSNEHLSKYSYWKSRYQRKNQDLAFDWFLDSEEILDFLLNSIEHSSHVKGKNQPLSLLDLGSGTSSLAWNILANSPRSVSLVLLDFVFEALQYQKQYMTTCTARIPESSFQLVCADVMFLPFCADSFNMAVDKGTMDALLKNKDKTHTKAEVMMSEVKRVMKRNGRFLQISDEDPDTRLVLLEELSKKFCDINSSHVSAELRATLDKQFPVVSFQSFIDTSKGEVARVISRDKMARDISKDEVVRDISKDEVASIKNNDEPIEHTFSFWSFKVIPSRWHKEYFIFWAEKL